MKICEETVKEKKKLPSLIEGHLYKNSDGCIFIYTILDHLISLVSGGVWSSIGGYGNPDNLSWEDVTDQYCLKKI